MILKKRNSRHQKKPGIVSILVLMEYDLKEWKKIKTKDNLLVSILVLMEYDLKDCRTGYF